MSSASSSAVLPAVEDRKLQDLWVEVLRILEPNMQRSQFITWFRDTALLGKDNTTIIVGLPLPMSLNWHMEHYRGPTLEAIQGLDSTIEKIVYKVDGALKDNRERSIDLLIHFPELKKRKMPGRQEVKMAEGIISKILNPRYSLERFIVGSGNRLAHAACQAVSINPGDKYNPLFLYGDVGLGKTHLLQATGNAILKTMPKAAVVYTTSEDFTNQVVEAIRTQKMEKLRTRYRKVDVLIIDDVQFLANKERTQEEFFHTFNALYEDNKQVIISADRPPQELKLDDRLVSRFSRGMIADVSAPDYETRLAILVEKTQDFELFLDMKVLEFIAEHTTGSVRDLEGILMQAVAQYELEQRMPTIKSIAEIMGKLTQNPMDEANDTGFEKVVKKRATFQDLMESTSRYYSVSIQDMVGTSRVHEILIPRQIAMYLGKKHLGITYVRLGEIFSNRDHTTVMNAVSKIERKAHNDPNLLREMRAIERELELV
ncbi:MAG: chromosomal replication initiator protein DnaA [bacterium]|nr:chromosomal replication initiator protein DnaA [bacterium]